MVGSILTVNSSFHATTSPNLEERNVAEALLRVSPPSSSNRRDEYRFDGSGIIPDTYAGLESLAEQANALRSEGRPHLWSSLPEEIKTPQFLDPHRDLSSGGLDALATLAFEARAEEARTAIHLKTNNLSPHLEVNGITSASPSSSSDDESDSMPPPPPRGRRRSASNPEGMEKWDSLGRPDRSSRRHFVLPAAILEEELAEASAAIQQRKLQVAASIPEEPQEACDDSSASPDSVMDLELSGTVGIENQSTPAGKDEEVDESKLTPEELLKRARSRLLEDLSEGNMNGEKGVLTLPHSLSKYKEVYNKNGRIGIYTPAERAAIIARFNKKRQRRVWNKKIRYNCRKSLADRRLRIKGRFVKRSEQEQLAKEMQARAEQHEMALVHDEASEILGSHPNQVNERQFGDGGDENMPDVNDPEANFSPTEDQPYRRLRRHTIT